MNLIRLYTVTGGHWIDAEKWQGDKEHLAAYTKDGIRIHDLDTPHYLRKKAENCFYGFIHRENLSSSKKEAIEKRDAIYKEMFPSLNIGGNTL